MANNSYYVHLKFKNYKEYGINYPKEGGASNYDSARKEIQEEIMGKADALQANVGLHQLEKRLNLIAGYFKWNPSVVNATNQQIARQIQDILNEIAQEIVGDSSAYIEEGFNIALQGGGDSVSTFQYQGQKGEMITHRETTRSFKRMKDYKLKSTSIKAWIKRLEKLKVMLGDALQQVSRGTGNTVALINMLGKIQQDINILNNNQSSPNAIANVQNSWLEIFDSFQHIFLKNITAKMDEFVTSSAIQLARSAGKITGMKVHDMLVDVLKRGKNNGFTTAGDSTGTVALKLNIETPEMQYRFSHENNSRVETDDDGNRYVCKTSVTPTQQKADFYITTEAMDQIKSGASFKSSSGTRAYAWIKLFEGNTSIYQMLQEYQQFLYHYMNLAANHKDGGDEHKLEQAKQDIRRLIIYKGINGSRFTLEGDDAGADCFIIHNRAANKYKVYSIPQLVREVENSTGGGNWITSSGNDMDFGAKLENIMVNRQALSHGERRAAAYDRVYNIIMQMHSRNINQIQIKVPLQ